MIKEELVSVKIKTKTVDQRLLTVAYTAMVIYDKFKFVSCQVVLRQTQIAKFMGPTWGQPGSCWPQMGPMLAP